MDKGRGRTTASLLFFSWVDGSTSAALIVLLYVFVVDFAHRPLVFAAAREGKENQSCHTGRKYFAEPIEHRSPPGRRFTEMVGFAEAANTVADWRGPAKRAEVQTAGRACPAIRSQAEPENEIRSGAVAAAPLEQNLGHFADARTLGPGRWLDVDAHGRQARDLAAVHADKMRMVLLRLAGALQFKAPDVIA